MRKEFWEVWIEDENRRETDFQRYLLSKKVKRVREVKELVEGHILKSIHNLKFVKSTLEMKEFNDWAIVSAYYAIYHASLALCALKGFTTKDHNATLLILIKEFYNRGLSKEEIDTIGNTTIEKEDVLYYVEARAKRTRASYSTQKMFDRKDAESLRLKAISFVNKVRKIIDSQKNI